MTAIEDIRAGIRALRLGGLPLCVHSSLRSFGWVEGGAATVVDGLLQEGCTVLVPAFADVYRIPPPDDPHLRPARNAYDYGRVRAPMPGVKVIYSPESNEIERAEMGAIPAEVVARPGRSRGNHPLDSFAAVGPLASKLVDGQAPRDVYAPLRALAERGGWVLLMGVDLNRLTLLHLAEMRAGRALFLRWANGPDGLPMGVESGGCSKGFPRLESVLAPLARETLVGSSRWRAFPADATLHAATAAIQRDPAITHCADPTCRRCADAIAGGPVFL
ncbi:MAG TPA: AAC(3) family N-acetyltransferase [Chloroflexota bacterium]|nr:AAC(3) family N-acetyltransferase [Chloroflexota bacterium]